MIKMTKVQAESSVWNTLILGGVIMADKLIGAEQLIELLKKHNHKELHVHHTWKPNHSHFNGDNHQKIQDGMRNSHINDRNFNDIAQHVTLFPDGLYMTGRAFNQSPASISGHNSGAFCVEMLGDFDIAKDLFGGKQKEAMLKIASFFNSQKKYIRFHNENASKTCPGTSLKKAVFMKEVIQYKENNHKEGVRMYKPSNGTLIQDTIEVLKELENKKHGDKAISNIHRQKLEKGELPLDDVVGILFTAKKRGLM